MSVSLIYRYVCDICRAVVEVDDRLHRADLPDGWIAINNAGPHSVSEHVCSPKCGEEWFQQRIERRSATNG